MILRFMKKHGWWYIPGIAFLFINSRLRTLIPDALGDAIDLLSSMVSGGEESTGGIYTVALKIFLLGLAVFLCTFVFRLCIIGNGRRLECYLRAEFFKKLQTLPNSYFEKRRSGDLIAYAISDTGAVRMAFGMVLAFGLNSCLTALFSIISMAGEIDGKLTLLALLPAPVAAVVLVTLGRLVRRRFTRVQELFSKISGFVNESIMGIRVIKTFSREKEWLRDFNEISEDMKDANIRLSNAAALIDPTVSVIFGLCYLISLIYGSILVKSGGISVGELVAFLNYLLLVQMPIVALGRIVNTVQRGVASYKRIKAVMNEPSIPPEEFIPDGSDMSGDIEFNNLSFRYDGAETDALSQISFTLKSGESLGIAGTTGCGKTTLLSLLLKFYQAPRGSIKISGKDICDISAATVRGAVGYVSQDGFLFSDTVTHNIEFYSGKSENEIRNAAALSAVEDDIAGFSEGYETEVGERGTHLSGGQKQRISLARALVRDPKILILDDTLSAVDNLTERVITNNLFGVLKGKTSIIVSHRLSVLKSCHNIIYMENGRIVESGTHDELMALGGKYAETYNSQREGEANE